LFIFLQFITQRVQVDFVLHSLYAHSIFSFPFQPENNRLFKFQTRPEKHRIQTTRSRKDKRLFKMHFLKLNLHLSTLLPLLALTATTTALIRPATIVPYALPEEAHTIEVLHQDYTPTTVEPRLVHTPPAHTSPIETETADDGNTPEDDEEVDDSQVETEEQEKEQEQPKRLHARSFVPAQKVLTAQRVTRALHEQQSHSEAAAEFNRLRQKLQAREFVAEMVHKMREAAVHKREVERIHKIARRAKTEEALREVLHLVNNVVQKRNEILEEQRMMRRREAIVEGIKEVLHLE
jgi:hypothetical protein